MPCGSGPIYILEGSHRKKRRQGKATFWWEFLIGGSHACVGSGPLLVIIASSKCGLNVCLQFIASGCGLAVECGPVS